jgi:uroporphyrinogen decarboxylase
MVKKLLNIFTESNPGAPPIWLMRQAGRYLPEYRAVRAQAGSFLDLCFNPVLAAEVTLQPIRRFDFDAAIIFADILLIPYALGRDLRFVEGEGPRLNPLAHFADLGAFDEKKLQPVYDALRLTRSQLAPTKTLIGFCGAPWTVACYMIEGGGSKNFAATLEFSRSRRAEFLQLLDVLAEVSAHYLCAQITAGAEVVQIFDSWAGLVNADDFTDFILTPTKKIIDHVKAQYPHTPVIGFPRGAGELYRRYRHHTGIAALGLDQQVSLSLAQDLQHDGIIQGNLDPALLVQGGAALRDGVAVIMNSLDLGKLIFNLGHGITQDTPPDHVAELVRFVREI